MLNNATKIMSQRNDYKDELVNELNTLGFEVSTLDNLIPTNTVEETKEQPAIIINKGHIVEVTNNELVEELQMQLDIAKEELDYYHDVEKDYNNDIKLFQEENAKLIDENMALENEITFKDGQIIGYKRQIKELEDKVAELQLALNAKKLTKKETVKGDDAVATTIEQPKKTNDKLALLKRVKEAEKRKEENANKNLLEEALKSAEEDERRKAEEKEMAKAQMPKYTLDYEVVTFDESIDSATMFGVQGTISFETKEYKFEATNNHHMPIVYGCFDEETRDLVKQIITNEIDRFNFMNEMEADSANYSHAHDEEMPLVVWRLTDEKGKVNYHGYTDKYILTWDKDKFAKHPGRKMIKNAFSNKPNMWKRVPNEQLADKFMAVCRELYAADFTNDDNDPEPTKEFFKITKEQHQPTNAVVYNGPMDNIGRPMDNTNDEEFLLEADDLDL
jgi:hypothetical protein